MPVLTPRRLAGGFAAYVAVIALSAGTFASGLTGPWYSEEVSRWVYATSVVAAAVFLVGLANLSYRISRSLDRRMQEVEASLETHDGTAPDTTYLRRREGIRLRQGHLSGMMSGPAAAAAVILGVSAALLPGTGSFLQRNFQLNAAVILAFSYAWPGIGVYLAVALYAVTGALRTERKRRESRGNGRSVSRAVREATEDGKPYEDAARALEDLSQVEDIGA